MGSRKEEEKNEKIIRGLMKLPPNRRCINCNALGPQYVCTSFWTFVCLTCSGIHREFTHRVKSVSMSKFTSQEVDALQNGGNQRARETYLKNWDFQRQRLPDSSNASKIREFIRNVYVGRRYAGAKSSEKPPRDPQSPTIHEDEIRRASSYHSYSQSPPYDYQYEDRRYGKQAAALTRKPGSDIVRYEGKISSIIYSPGRFSDHAYDDRFANEESGPRISDFSVSSGGEQFKSDVQSSKFHKDLGFSSPSYQHSGSRSSTDVWSQARNTPETSARSDADGIYHPQRTTSLQSTDSNFLSLRSSNSGGVVDFFSEPVQASGSLENKVAGIPQLSGPTRSVSMDLSTAPLASELLSSSSASSIDHFQLPAAPSKAPLVDMFQSSVLSAAPSSYENQPVQTSQPSSVDFFADLSQKPSTATSAAPSQAPSVDLFHSSTLSGAPSFNGIQPVQTSQPLSIDFFADLSQQPSNATSEAPSQAASVNLFQSSNLSSALSFNGNKPAQTPQPSPINFLADLSQKPPAAIPDEMSHELSVPKNDRWETFDMPQCTSSTLKEEIPAAVPSSAESFQERFDSFSNLNANMQLPSLEISCGSVPSSVTSNSWRDGVWNGGQVTVILTTTQVQESSPWNALEDPSTHPPVDALSQGLRLHEFPSAYNQFLGLTLSEGSNKGGVQGMTPVGEFGYHDIPSHVSGTPHPLMGDIKPNGINRRSNNPFDYLYDSDAEHNNRFFDMCSLQAALPDGLLPATFNGGITEPWLPQNTVTPYISSAGEGGLSFMAAQPLGSQIQNIQTQEPIATVGGNPFA